MFNFSWLDFWMTHIYAGQPKAALEQWTTDSCQKEANCLLTLLEPVLITGLSVQVQQWGYAINIGQDSFKIPRFFERA